MKKLILISILFFCVTTTFAQELPEIPMKNGMVYFSFEHKLDNTKKCISQYINTPEFLQKKGSYLYQFVFKKVKKPERTTFGLNTPINFNTKCNDTIKNASGFSLSEIGGDLWRPIIIELLRKKIRLTEITAQIEVVFLSKTEYKLVFKDLTYKISWSQGIKNGIDIHKIGELYEKTKALGKITKSDIKFFEKLNFFMQAADEIILKALTDAYQADEL